VPFIAEWAENYALEWLKDHLSQFLPEIVSSRRKEIAGMEEKGIPLWPLLPQELREKALSKAFIYSSTIIALDPDAVVNIILECLNERELNLNREWVKSNLLAFREELLSSL